MCNSWHHGACELVPPPESRRGASEFLARGRSARASFVPGPPPIYDHSQAAGFCSRREPKHDDNSPNACQMTLHHVSTPHSFPSSSPLRCKWQRCLVSLILLAALATFVQPTDATAKAGYELRPGGIHVVLATKKSATYLISVSAHDRQHVQFTVDTSSSNIEYSTPGRVTSQHIYASFGDLGRVDVELHLVRTPTTRTHNGRCKGRAPLLEEGRYDGTLTLSGEQDVPYLSATQGRVYFERRFPQVCRHRTPRAERRPGADGEFVLLTGSGTEEGRVVLFRALTFSSIRHPTRLSGRLTAEAYETHDRVSILRETSVSIDRASFAVSPLGSLPEIVSVQPPAPFTGHAIYSDRPNSPSTWSGDLSVELPGLGGVALSDAGLRVSFCRGSSVSQLTHCLSVGHSTSQILVP